MRCPFMQSHITYCSGNNTDGVIQDHLIKHTSNYC